MTNISAFQYITCYSLSLSRGRDGGNLLQVSIHHMLLFIKENTKGGIVYDSFNTSHVTLYPSTHTGTKRHRTRFNTSHVTLYPFVTLYHLILLASFNTSHVTLYPVPPGFMLSSLYVSIHHMLLFIPHPYSLLSFF